MLYIVSTPIGNLKDITLRAIEVLKQVDLIAAEDTRHTKILLKAHGISTPLTSYFEHNKFKKADYILKLLHDGKDVALVTDAGTPSISDPGYRLVKLAKEQGVALTVVPGPCALIAALTLCGLPSNSFVFEGFLPTKTTARKKKLLEYENESRTVVFYESPYRIIKVLTNLNEIMPGKHVVIARELTKKFEEVVEGTPKELVEYFQKKKPKGEFVLLLGPDKK